MDPLRRRMTIGSLFSTYPAKYGNLSSKYIFEMVFGPGNFVLQRVRRYVGARPNVRMRMAADYMAMR